MIEPLDIAAMGDHELAVVMHEAERRLDFDIMLLCENEISGRIELDPNETEQGLTPAATAKIDDFVATHYYA